MKTNNKHQWATYLPPESEEMRVEEETSIASNDPGTWNNGGIDDDFNDLYDF